uniref:F-box domain-containing protein n=1 Tax=Angiostrongylus cantonensis TaxID=6313 RepID=A0A0K0D2F4_ANGCA
MMSNDVFDILNLPTTAVRRILHFLRYPYLRNLAIAIPSFSSLCKEEYRKVEHEVQARRFFKWSRFASSNNEDSMAPRGLHTMVYHEKECAMYVFGGEAPDWRLQGDSGGPASFNDLWKLDMASNFVSLATTNDGPNLAGHASCMHGDLFIVHGGMVSTCEVSYRVSVLDMQTKRWFHAPLPGFPTVLHHLARSPIPSFVVGSSSLIVLREGCLLATGENVHDDMFENVSILFLFDPKDPEGVQWQYKLVPGVGRWWPPAGLSPPPSNKHFGGIAVMCCDRFIRARFLSKPRTIDLVTITVAVDPYGESQRSTPLDEVDVFELKLRLRTMIAQLHMKYYSTRPDVLLSPNLPSRNSSFRRMVVFTAEIPAGEESDPMRDLQIIECVPFTDISLGRF